MAISLHSLSVFVTDLAQAKAFYKDVLRLPLRRETNIALEFFHEGTHLSVDLASMESASIMVGRPTGITLAVDDLNGLCGRLKEAGVEFVQEPAAYDWGKMAMISDKDGNTLVLMERSSIR